VSLHGYSELEVVAIEPMPVLSSEISLQFNEEISRLQVVFFLPWLLLDVMIEVMGQTCFSLKGGGQAENERYLPMRECLDNRLWVVFSFCSGGNGHEARCCTLGL
jgi:hypothetical protein